MILMRFLLFIPLIFLLSACLDFERASIYIDLIHKVGEVRYSNIVSNSKEDKTIHGDFKNLIKNVYFEDDPKTDPHQITSKRLYRNNEQLDGIARFSFQNTKEALKGLNIETNETGDYFMDITREMDYYHIVGNGQSIEKGSKRLLKWNKNTEKIELEWKSREFDPAKKTSLLRYWLDWVDKSLKE